MLQWLLFIYSFTFQILGFTGVCTFTSVTCDYVIVEGVRRVQSFTNCLGNKITEVVSCLFCFFYKTKQGWGYSWNDTVLSSMHRHRGPILSSSPNKQNTTTKKPPNPPTNKTNNLIHSKETAGYSYLNKI